MDVATVENLPQSFRRSTLNNLNYWRSLSSEIDMPWLVREHEKNLIPALLFGLKFDESSGEAQNFLAALIPYLDYSRLPNSWMAILSQFHPNPSGAGGFGSTFALKTNIALARLLISVENVEKAEELLKKYISNPDSQRNIEGTLKLLLLYAHICFLKSDLSGFENTLEGILDMRTQIPDESFMHVEIIRLEAKQAFLKGYTAKAIKLLKRIDRLPSINLEKRHSATIKIEMAALYLQVNDFAQALKQLSRATTFLSGLPHLYQQWTRLELLRSIAHSHSGNHTRSQAFLENAALYLSEFSEPGSLRIIIDNRLSGEMN